MRERVAKKKKHLGFVETLFARYLTFILMFSVYTVLFSVCEHFYPLSNTQNQIYLVFNKCIESLYEIATSAASHCIAIFLQL